MESLQTLCCIEICLNPERTLSSCVNDLNLPCLEKLVGYLAVKDILQHEACLNQRGIDTEAALLMIMDNVASAVKYFPIRSTTCPHFLALFPHSRLKRILTHILKICFLFACEHLETFEHFTPKTFDSCVKAAISESFDVLMPLFCNIDGPKYYEKRKKTMPEDSLWNMLMLAAGKVLQVSVTANLCRFFTNPYTKPIFDILLEKLEVLAFILKSFNLMSDFAKLFKKHAKSLRLIRLDVFRNHDLLCLDEILCVCSGVVGFHKTSEGKKDKIALDSMLSAVGVSSNSEPENAKPYQHLLDDKVEKIDGCCHGENTETANSTDGLAQANFKFTDLVETSYYAPTLEHHFKHWLALKELHLGVSKLHFATMQGIVCLLKRPQFKSFLLSSAEVSYAEMETILQTLVDSRGNHPLEKLMFVSLTESNDRGRGQREDERHLSFSPLSYSDCGFQGTELLEIYICGMDIDTQHLLTMYMIRDMALKVLCLKMSFSRRVAYFAYDSLTEDEYTPQFRSLILEDQPLCDRTGMPIFVEFLRRMSPTLTSLSLKGCLAELNCCAMQEVIAAVSECSNLTNLDLSENDLEHNCRLFCTIVMENTELSRLSLKDNRIKAAVVRETIAVLHKSVRRRKERMTLLDLRGNEFMESEQKVERLQRAFVDKIMYTKCFQ